MPNSRPTLFGGSIQNIEVSAAYGIDGGTAQISLVFPGDGPGASEDFSNRFPKLGSPIGIVWGEFSFGGILQRYLHNKSLSGYTWDVVLESPGRLLQGIQIILDAYDGTNFYGQFPSISSNVFVGGNIRNIWNVFGVRENYFTGGVFGGSNVNSLGFPALDAVNIIESISRSEEIFGGQAKFGDHFYEVDLSPLKTFVNEYYRLKGPIQSLGSIIDDCCSIFSHDFIPTIRPKSGKIITNGLIENPVLSIFINQKTYQPEPDRIKDLVKDYESQGRLISANFGKEFVNNPTQRLVIGGPASKYEIIDKTRFIPVWGFRTAQKIEAVPSVEANFYIGTNYSPNSNAFVPILDNKVANWLRANFPQQTNFGEYWAAKVLEVRCAISGFDTWAMYHILNKSILAPYLYTYCDIQDESSYNSKEFDLLAINAIKNGDPMAYQYCSGKTKAGSIPEDFKTILNDLCSAISNSGNEFYGRKFLVQLSEEPGGIFNNIKWIPEEYRAINAWDIADSAWVEPSLYGPMRVDAYRDISFYDGEGKLRAACEWLIQEGNLVKDFSSISDSYEMQGRTIASSNVQVDSNIYVQNGHLYALVTVPPVYLDDGYMTDSKFLFQYMQILGLIPNAEFSYNALLNAGMDFNSIFSFSLSPAMDIPYVVGVPRQSNKYSWGTWWNKIEGDGSAEVIIEDSLRPETYGSYGALQQVAFSAYAHIENSGIGDTENGSMEVTGVPEYNIAERMAGSGPYLTGIDISVSSDGITTSYKFNSWTPQFGRLSRFNADRLSNINKNNIRFLQEQRQKFKKPALPSFSEMLRRNIENSRINNMYAIHGPSAILNLGNDNDE